jgi:hypothetical protein
MDKALARIRQLRGERGMTGQEIAQVLLEEGFSIEDARGAFFQEGYVASTEPFTRDISMLHVSDRPMKAGLDTILMAIEPCCLPSVVWCNH